MHNATHGKPCKPVGLSVAVTLGRCRWHRRGRSVDRLVRGDRHRHHVRPPDVPRRAQPPGLADRARAAGRPRRDRRRMDRQRRATGAGGRTRGDLGRPARAHVGRNDRPPSGRAGGSACHGTPRRCRRVTGRPPVVAGSRAIGPGSGHLRARVRCHDRARRRLRSADRPGVQPHVRASPSPGGRPRFEPDRLPDRDGPHRVGGRPGARRARPGGAPRSIRWCGVGNAPRLDRPDHVVDRPRCLVDGLAHDGGRDAPRRRRRASWSGALRWSRPQRSVGGASRSGNWWNICPIPASP